MSKPNVSNFDPNYKQQQKAKKSPSNSGKCITADTLGDHIDVKKFNTMMSKTVDTATSFLTSYQAEQNAKLPDQSALDYERYKQTALNKQRSMIEKHELMMIGLQQTFEYYKGQLMNTKSVQELHDMLIAQNTKLKGGVESEIHTIEISDRKTYYESEENESAGWWSNILSMLYKYLVILVIVTIIMKKQYHDKKLWGMVIGLILYPYIIYYMIDLLVRIYNWLISNTKWVYLKL
jgi:hypothetical protein|tara:strand:+ start:2195 stop:2899 length:705 start_codon:yes stop_codon:yes gene_type:complete